MSPEYLVSRAEGDIVVRHHLWRRGGIRHVVVEMKDNLRVRINAAACSPERRYAVGIRLNVLYPVREIVGECAVRIETDKGGATHFVAAPYAGIYAIAV